MSIDTDVILGIALAYVGGLFLLAWLVDRQARRGGARWLRSPLVYTLSLSVYCTAWTFYGAVGSAARSGLEYLAIYIGPTLVMVGWWWTMRKIVRIGRTHRITSIADMISSRYGKSSALGALATLAAVMAATPYVGLQLQSLTRSWAAISGGAPDDIGAGLVAAGGLAAFTILFGTRSLDEGERHHGLVAAIALEAVVKLAALLAVAGFAAFGLGAMPGSDAAQALNLSQTEFGGRWTTLLFLSAAAMICLPRQFHVAVVENTSERHLATASWAFPLYLLLISICVLPIAAAGLAILPEGSDPDLFVLTAPMAAGADAVAALAFIGGVSAATSMVIMSSIALSTMISNHIVAPLLVAPLGRMGRQRDGQTGAFLLGARRVAILGILALGFAYLRLSGGSVTLSSIGAIAFCGAAQFLPAIVAGVAWRGATRAGAMAGLCCGVALWLYTLFLPAFGGTFVLSAQAIADGPFGLSWLRPRALLGADNLDPMVHATLWSLGVNAAALVIVSLLTRMDPLERLQAALFVDVYRSNPLAAAGVVRRPPARDDLFLLAERILGHDAATSLFEEAARKQGLGGATFEPTPDFVSLLERRLAGSVGAAAAHTMVSRAAGGETISLTDLIGVADENVQLRRASQALRAKSREAEEIAAPLRDANERLRVLDSEKDAFLCHISHELRTPMTSVRSFAEIMRSETNLSQGERDRFAGIIESESMRLTRLLDELLDFSQLGDRRAAAAHLKPCDPEAALDRAIDIALTPSGDDVALRFGPRASGARTAIDPDRLTQVFINLLANAVKHSDRTRPCITISSHVFKGRYRCIVADDGPGIAPADRERIFESFVRNPNSSGVGLGLPISHRIVQGAGGALSLATQEDGPWRRGARFVVELPLAPPDTPSGKA